MSLSTYSGLSTAIGTWGTRTYTSGQTDEFILIAESAANRRLGSNYRRKTQATVNTNSSGVGTLPTDSVRVESMVRNVVGSVPLKQVSWDALIARNPYQISDDAGVFAVRGLSFQVAPVTDDDFILAYWAVLTGLSGSNASNWLLTLAPDYYLFACRAAQAAFEEEWQTAAIFEAKASGVLDELQGQADVAEYGNAEMTLDMVTP